MLIIENLENIEEHIIQYIPRSHPTENNTIVKISVYRCNLTYIRFLFYKKMLKYVLNIKYV